MTDKKEPRFTDLQQLRLLNIGLIQSQIDRLEAHALPLAKAWTRPLPDATAVRRELCEMQKLVFDLQVKMQELAQAMNGSGKQEALVRIEQAIFDLHIDGSIPTPIGDDPVGAWSSQIAAMLSAVQKASDEMPQGRRCTIMTNNPRLIGFIENDLLEGWIAAQNRDVPFPSYPDTFRRSSSDGCCFREVVETCYQAVGVETGAERAIKEYIRRKSKKTKAHSDEK